MIQQAVVSAALETQKLVSASESIWSAHVEESKQSQARDSRRPRTKQWSVGGLCEVHHITDQIAIQLGITTRDTVYAPNADKHGNECIYLGVRLIVIP
jgi:hypothetical protein